MATRRWIWIAAAAVVAAVAIYLMLPREDGVAPGQNPPHAIKQSQSSPPSLATGARAA